MEYVGKVVAKTFGGVKYAGKVVSADRVGKNDVWFRVHYEDGDEEELTLAEVRSTSQQRLALTSTIFFYCM